MTTEQRFDVELSPQDIQSISSADALVSFFAKLGYNTASRTAQTATNLAIAEAAARPIKRIELIADHQKLLQLYLFELKTVTVAEIKALARVFRNFAGQFLLVLTADYEYIEFVLLDRQFSDQKNPTAIGTVQPLLVQRRFSVDRRRPTPIHLRVLRRFTWTETDTFSQFDKLRFAYDLAHWSEAYFNNRGLFSDYFLTERLRPKDGGHLEFPEWREDPKPAYQRLRATYDQASTRFAGKTTTELISLLYDPLLQELGFRPSIQTPAETSVCLRLDDPQSGALLGICLPFPWGRELDRKDAMHDTENPEVTPAFAVVDLLAKEKSPWVILTNGKLWRLYSQRAHSRATNYYEVDLDEVLGRQGFHQDIQDAFRFFWLLFRSQAFRPAEVQWQGKAQSLSMLDRLLLGSEEYAKQLGETLKDRVFTEVFPVLAEGFIANARQRASDSPKLDDERLSTIFQGTLTLLYRLLFLLYAESRDLLPVHSREYRDASLRRMNEEISESAGKIADQTEKQISKSYDTASYGLWQRLKALFRVIDQGSEELNVPRYNGGLFMSSRDKNDRSPEAEAAHFLEQERVPDRHLARAIDLLARGIDPKRHDLVFVDYKSLGVRQLGSIYEGLLEFRLRIASEKLGIVKEKGREVYKPFSELTDREEARAENDKTHVPRGHAYLENDNRERKATGSYYTPDHIVQYIVQNAVGPILVDRFDALRPKLRDAQHKRRQFIKQQEEFTKRGMKHKPHEQGDLIGRELVEALFSAKVLDPAMGSGHFLVEAVDFITDKTLEFLNAFPWNPVLVHLEQMRKTIQEQMDEQNVEIDANRLTDVNLLKRHVLKRCIYGVDLNPMAVELAKVSLWLDCFTLGAPLSFLDHHLRSGNSLIGSTMAEVDAIRQAKGQLALTETSDWQGLTQAVQGMIAIGGMPDITADQVAVSKKQFRSALADVEVFKKVLDLHIARWFVDEDNSTKNTRKSKIDIFDEMLRSGDLFEWAHGRMATPVIHTAMAIPARAVVETASRTAENKRFFHWELEFPEVFYGARAGTRSAVERLEKAGFDTVIGNPPYDVISERELGRDVSSELGFYRGAPVYAPADRGKHNLYKFFVCRAVSLLNRGGYTSFIVPMSLLGNEQDSGLRTLLLRDARITRIEAFPQKDDSTNRVFQEAKLSTAIFLAKREGPQARMRIRTHPGSEILESSATLSVALEEIARFDPENLPLPSCTQRDWEIATRIMSSPGVRRLRDFCRASQGEINETTDGKKGYVSRDPAAGPLILRGAAVSLYVIRDASQGEPIYLRRDRFIKGKPDSEKALHYTRPRVGWQESSAQNNFRRIIAAAIPQGSFCNHKINYIPESASQLPLDFVLALLNSKVSDWIFRLSSTSAAVSHYQVDQLPVPTITEGIPPINWATLVDQHRWTELPELVPLDQPGFMPKFAALAVEQMCRRIREIEEQRRLTNKSGRSHLADESQPIQDTIDQIIFACLGLSREEASFVDARLREML